MAGPNFKLANNNCVLVEATSSESEGGRASWEGMSGTDERTDEKTSEELVVVVPPEEDPGSLWHEKKLSVSSGVSSWTTTGSPLFRLFAGRAEEEREQILAELSYESGFVMNGGEDDMRGTCWDVDLSLSLSWSDVSTTFSSIFTRDSSFGGALSCSKQISTLLLGTFIKRTLVPSACTGSHGAGGDASSWIFSWSVGSVNPQENPIGFG